MSRFFKLLLLLIILSYLSSCGGKKYKPLSKPTKEEETIKIEDAQLADKVVLVVNSEPVLLSDIEFAKTWFNEKDTKKATNRLIDEILLSQEARKIGISVSPQEIDEAILRIAKANNINNLEEFKKGLEKQGVSYRKLRDFIQRDIQVAKFMQFYLRPQLSKNVLEGKQDLVRKIDMIYIDKSDEKYKEKLQKLKDLNKENFAEIAKTISDYKDISMEVKKGDMIPQLDEEIFKHKVGDIFKVETDKAIYYVYIKGEEKKFVPDFEMKKEDMEKFEKDFDIYIKKLREKATIMYLDESLK
ncbi:hypothetical protein JCM14244_10060 [Venenivibrio stagnispumantis]|uniref:Peptidyl-prolyl cis-trans isomerase SurA n=1 Tax=Venenivibrio stagnispumantis TaxID=407998 RepID=A0AA45WMJ3_9AQUI|nr:SurA N-terminal domain-containing protein [Venenivibrio stagnispumantis]MCW4573643.1 SurA N-terminal domain-containing protein [Venenivibrio stagnispumantis]SMP14382.1 peptidyl-prolyl cis-trans isomerase SurA [Venenivibrio stagnispumantis]